MSKSSFFAPNLRSKKPSILCGFSKEKKLSLGQHFLCSFCCQEAQFFCHFPRFSQVKGIIFRSLSTQETINYVWLIWRKKNPNLGHYFLCSFCCQEARFFGHFPRFFQSQRHHFSVLISPRNHQFGRKKGFIFSFILLPRSRIWFTIFGNTINWYPSSLANLYFVLFSEIKLILNI